MKEAYISYADEQTGYTYNVQIVVDGVYIAEAFYTDDLCEAFMTAEQHDCTSIFTTF